MCDAAARSLHFVGAVTWRCSSAVNPAGLHVPNHFHLSPPPFILPVVNLIALLPACLKNVFTE
jgi:hypothetical protein